MPFNASLQNCIRILPIVTFETASCTEANSTCVSLWFSGSAPWIGDHTDIKCPERDEVFPEVPRPEVRDEERFVIAFPDQVAAVRRRVLCPAFCDASGQLPPACGECIVQWRQSDMSEICSPRRASCRSCEHGRFAEQK